MLTMIFLVSSLLFLVSPVSAYSAVFNIASGDVQGLIAAINAANANGEDNTINLEPGIYSLNGVNTPPLLGLPIIDSILMINGNSAENTIIERHPEASDLTIFSVGFSGSVVINRLTVRRGGGIENARGLAGISNAGRLTIRDARIERSSVALPGFQGVITNNDFLGLVHTQVTNNEGVIIINGGGGFAQIINSSIIENDGFIHNRGGTMNIRKSTISNNISRTLIENQSIMTIADSTIAKNAVEGSVIFSGPERIGNANTLSITSSTISANYFRQAGDEGTTVQHAETAIVTMQNTIIALNGDLRDCPIMSLGNNVFGNPTGCSATLHPTDLTGDPGLAAFVDDGTPGHGRFPLLPGSPAIDAGNNGACLPTDQLDTPRRGSCDIGAVEFYPIVNDLVAVGSLSTAFDATPVPGGPAGTFRITAEFTNTSNQAIVNPFTEVVDLSGGNLLLNADGGAGGIGARLKPADSSTIIFQPGTTSTFDFLIGLQQSEAFTFFVNMLGDPQTSRP